jgi:hypothetical protein
VAWDDVLCSAGQPPALHCSSQGSHRTAVGCRLRLWAISACVNGGNSLPPASCGRHAHSQQSPLPLLAMTDSKNSSTANPFEQHHGPGLRHNKLFVGMRRSANDDIDARAAARAVEEAAAAEEAALAQAGWEEMYDPDSRKVYWVNHRLNATRYVTLATLCVNPSSTHTIFFNAACMGWQVGAPNSSRHRLPASCIMPQRDPPPQARQVPRHPATRAWMAWAKSC